MRPVHPKVTGSTLGGALVAIVVAELSRRGVDLTVDEVAGLTVIGAFAGGWLKRITEPDRRR